MGHREGGGRQNVIVLLDKDLPTASGLMASQDHPNPSSATPKDTGCWWGGGGHGWVQRQGRASGLPLLLRSISASASLPTQAAPKEAPRLRVSRSPWAEALRGWERLRHSFL